MANIQTIIEDILQETQPNKEGVLASYIPELAKVDPELYSISVVTIDGNWYEAGNKDTLFTMQSISKPFVYGLALEEHGLQRVHQRVGLEPTGDPFHSMFRLDSREEKPRNPMINAGAIAMTDMIPGATVEQRLEKMLSMFSDYTGRALSVDDSVYQSESETGDRNRALAYLLKSLGVLARDIKESLSLYFQQCSLLVTTHDLAMMAATLANRGVNPVTGLQANDVEHVRDILSVMYSCGLYTYAGEWNHRVGLPAKSGVSGGILIVVPGRMGIGIYSPRIDSHGNSNRGVQACQLLSSRLRLHIFG